MTIIFSSGMYKVSAMKSFIDLFARVALEDFFSLISIINIIKVIHRSRIPNQTFISHFEQSIVEIDSILRGKLSSV